MFSTTFRVLPLVIIFCLSGAGYDALAQATFVAKEIKQIVEAKQISGKPEIDGKLDETCWQTAEGITDFVQIEPRQGEATNHPTTVRILYDLENLYIGVFCSDSLGRKAIRATDLKRDFDWRSHDTFAICIDGFNDKRNSISFVTNPFGAQKDYLSFDATLFDSDWNGRWKVRTSITAEGWIAEFEIPWKTLRYAKEPSASLRSWGINFLRLRRATNEISVWSPYPRSFSFNRMEYAGVVTKIMPPPPVINVQANPYTLVSGSRKTDEEGTSVKTKIGGELKWVVNTNLVADLTLNTDFAQADADVQVNNVSRFSVLFPEKRQFFLENASLFGSGLVSNDNTGGSMQVLPFFSRRIGLSGSGNPIPVDAGLRLVNRSMKTNYGILVTRQRGYDTLSSANMMVGRYSRNFGKQNRLGGIATMKSINSANGSYTNWVGGLDGFFRFDAAQSLNVMAMQSINSDGTGKGFGGYAQYYYATNNLTFWVTETILTKNFNAELGFLSRTDVIATTPGIVANIRGPYLPLKKYIRSFQPALTAGWYHRSSTGHLTERDIKFTPFWIEMQDGGHTGFSINAIHQSLLSPFNPLGIVIDKGLYDYLRYTISTGTDPSRKISATFRHEFGNYFDGRLRTTDFSLSLIPIPHISMKGSMNRNEFAGVGAEPQKKTITLYTIQTILALNPRIQLIGLYQKNSANNLNAFNIRFMWEYKPLSYFYIVVNNRQFVQSEKIQSEAQAIVKLSYLKQF